MAPLEQEEAPSRSALFIVTPHISCKFRVTILNVYRCVSFTCSLQSKSKAWREDILCSYYLIFFFAYFQDIFKPPALQKAVQIQPCVFVLKFLLFQICFNTAVHCNVLSLSDMILSTRILFCLFNPKTTAYIWIFGLHFPMSYCYHRHTPIQRKILFYFALHIS